MTYEPNSAADDDLVRGVLRAAIRLRDGDDPIDIGKYAFEPTAEEIAEILRKTPPKPVLVLRYDREIDLQMIRAYAEAIAEGDPDQSAKIQKRLKVVESDRQTD